MRDDDNAPGLPGLWCRDLRDRLRGNAARANARWGFLSAPPGPGRLIWIKAGADDDSLLLGAELTRAIRRKRLDVRLAFTFERDSPLIASYVQGLKGVGVGYGPIERRSAIARVVSRFAPLGVVFAGVAPGPIFGETLAARGVHGVVVAAAPRRDGRIGAAYPANPGQAHAWESAHAASTIAPPADPLALLVEAQIDPNFKTLVAGGRDVHLWWLQGMSATTAVEPWNAFPLRERSILFVSGASGGTGSGAFARMSEWRRGPIAPGTVMVIDDPRWHPAIAASATAVHLIQPSRAVFWQALSGGCPVTLGDAGARTYLNDAVDPDALPVVADLASVFARWQQDAEQVIVARRRGDALRRVFWQERRRAGERSDQLLRHVYDW